MNKNPKLYNAVKVRDLKLSPELAYLIDDQIQDMDLRVISKGWVADMMQMMKDSDEYDVNVFTELAELAKLMVDKRIQVIVL